MPCAKVSDSLSSEVVGLKARPNDSGTPKRITFESFERNSVVLRCSTRAAVACRRHEGRPAPGTEHVLSKSFQRERDSLPAAYA